ncbi:MAG: hypothetical protein V2A76_00865 [Planctomycetota bacterium]
MFAVPLFTRRVERVRFLGGGRLTFTRSLLPMAGAGPGATNGPGAALPSNLVSPGNLRKRAAARE